MATPAIVAITPADTWVKVATSVITGKITKADVTKNYLHTYVDTGGAAPTGLSISRPFEGICARIVSNTEIDVYIYCLDDTGSVLVEL